MEAERSRKETGIGDGPGEFEVVVKCVGKADDLFKLLMGPRGSTDIVIDVAEEEVGDSASVTAEKGLFHVPYEEAGIAWAHASAHNHRVGRHGGSVVSTAASQRQGLGFDSILGRLSVWSLHILPVS
eukprot:g20710.t1